MTQTQLVHVNPGDRITADYINSLVDEINSLQQQVDAIGTTTIGNAPVIIGLQPSDQVAVGAELDVIGRNFGVPAIQNEVTLDGTAVTGFLPGCSDTLLKLAVPEIAGVPKDAQLVVQTSVGSATHTVRVVAATQIPEGQPTITNATAALGTITTGSTYTFSFLVDASTVSITETYTIAVTYANTAPASVPASAWTTGTTLIGASNQQVTVTPGTPVTIGVQVTVPANATAADLTFALTSVHNPAGSSATPTAVPIRVGQAPPQSDARIHLSIGAIGPAFPFKEVPINGVQGIEVKFPTAAGSGTLAQVPIDVSYDVAGTIAYTVSIENPDTTIWTVGAATPNPFQYAAGGSGQVHFPLTLLATTGGTEGRFLNFVATRQDNDGIGQISNFLRFPIQGFVS